MDFLKEDHWIRHGAKNLNNAKVHHVSPKNFVILPDEPVPDHLREQLEKIKKLFFAPGISASALTISAGLQPESTYLLAVLGKKIGLWTLWPEYSNPLWIYDMGNLPLLQ